MKKRRLLATLLAVLLLAGLIYDASLRVPTGPAAGTAVDGPIERPATGPTFRIGTYNIHGGRGSDGRRDLARVAQGLDDLDFVALNEVHGPWFWESEDQARQLGERLGRAWLFAPSVRTWYHWDWGNGLLTRLLVASWKRIPLERHWDHSYRNAVLVDLPYRDQTIHVLLTHVTHGTKSEDRERQQQLRTVIALYLALPEPAILLGDLNTTADDPQIRQLLAVPGVIDPLGQVLGAKTPPRIDWIIARGLRCVDAGIRDNGASDHPLIWAELAPKGR